MDLDIIDPISLWQIIIFVVMIVSLFVLSRVLILPKR